MAVSLLAAMVMDVEYRASAAEAPVARDPFWPVGYVHRDTTTVAAAESPAASEAPVIKAANPEPAKPDPLIIVMKERELAEKIRAACQVSGFLKSGEKQMAVVNGQVVGIGDRLPVTVDSLTYNFKVTGVSPTTVKLEPVQ